MIEQQQTHRIGDALVTRIPELLLRDFKTTGLIPDWQPEAAEPQAVSIVPDCLNEVGTHVVVSTHSWLVRTPRHIVIVDTAVGNGKTRAIPAFDHLQEPYLQRLAAAGVTPDMVDCVLLTHLHSDHVGWNTRIADGRWVPTFPNARYVMARLEQERLAGLWKRMGRMRPRLPSTPIACCR